MKYKLRRLTCLLLCLIVSFVAMAPPAAQAFVAEAALVYKLAEVLLVGCGIYHVATSDASHALVEGLFNAYPTTKQMCDNYAQQVVGGKLWVTSKFLEDIKPFYQSVRDFFADGFASGGGSVNLVNPFTGDSNSIDNIVFSKPCMYVWNLYGSPQAQAYDDNMTGGSSVLICAYDKFGVLQVHYASSIYTLSDRYRDYLNYFSSSGDGLDKNKKISLEQVDGKLSIVSDYDYGVNHYHNVTSLVGQRYYVPVKGLSFVGDMASTVPYTVDQTLTADDVIDGWSRDWPDGSVDPDQAKAPVINIPADAGALTGAKAGDVWPRQDAGEVVVPGSPTLGNVYDRLGTLNDIASGVKTGVDSLTGALEGVNVGVGTIAGIISAIKDFIDSIRKAIENFFDSPSDFDLNFDGFKSIILPDRFPFCIPFDFIKSIKVFAAAARDFKFNIDLKTQYFEIHHEVDLTPFSIPIAFFRYVVVIWFVWILLTRTRDMMKW